MTISFSCDHGGFELREVVIEHLKTLWHTVLDLSPNMLDPLDDFPDYAERVCVSIQNNEAERGVLICGTWIGMSIAANRHKNIRAVVAYSPEITKISRSHNNVNVACFWARTMKQEDVFQSLDVFLSEPFLGEKYQRRNDKLDLFCWTCQDI